LNTHPVPPPTIHVAYSTNLPNIVIGTGPAPKEGLFGGVIQVI